MQTYNVSSFREANYGSAIIPMDSIKEEISTISPNNRFYFSLNLFNGSTKVFYVELIPSKVSGKFIYSFYRDYTTYSGAPGMPSGAGSDLLIKAYASTGIAEDEKNSLVETIDTSVMTAMSTYVSIFIDAVQVMAASPF